LPQSGARRAVGNTVVWKPSPLAALLAYRLLELFEAAGCRRA
jgi:acyl-CoA reductase-like NAD-dependent aldehyde dehydrogenase